MKTGRTAKAIIDEEPMGIAQWVAIAVTVCLNALDGIDVLSISYAAPGIAAEWKLAPSVLGWILSMELIGMAFGSMLLGGAADRFGRRPTILSCLSVMGIGMWLAAHAGSVFELISWRLITGLGIGGMLAAINAAAAEYANNRRRSLAMALMVIGYPLGGALGGVIARQLLQSGYDWRTIFEFGALSTLIFIPLVYFLAPETCAFLDRRQPPGALVKVNRILARMGKPAVATLAPKAAAARVSLVGIFSPQLRTTTLLITTAYFAHITSFYFLIKWTPKVVVGLGYAPAAAAGVLAWANIGGAAGGALFGLLAAWFSLKRLTIATLIGTTATVAWFGLARLGIEGLNLQILLAGFFANSGIAGLYLLFAKLFPTELRATGTGFVIGVGRGAAALAPVAGGYLFDAGFGLAVVAILMGSGSLVAALALRYVTERAAD